MRDLGSTHIGQGEVVSAEKAWLCIQELQQRLARIPELPPWRGQPVAENIGVLWWFLRDRRLDVDEALEKLVACVQWRAEFRVERLGPELFAREMRSQKGYLHRHLDVMGRPVLVATASRHNVLDRRLQEDCRMCAWMLENALDRLASDEPPALAPAGGATKAQVDENSSPEQALGIFDLREFSPLQADLEVASFLVDVLYKYYPLRTGRVLLVGAPDVFRSFWNSVKPWLGHYASLADFVTVDEVRRDYFLPGLAPPGFGEDAAAAGVRRHALERAAWPKMQQRRSPLLFVGATLAASAAFGRRRRAAMAALGMTHAAASSSLQSRQASTLGPRGRITRPSLPGLGTYHIGEGAVDAETACKFCDELRQQLRRLGPDLPLWHGRPATDDDKLLWWFLRDRQLDVNAAASKLLYCLRWRSKFRVDYLGPELFSREMRSRKAYLHQHPDIVGRPALVVIAQKHNLMERRLEQSCQMCAWFMEQTMERLATEDPREPKGDLDNEDVEQAIGIIDLQNFSPLQADLEFATFLVQALHDYYPGRFARILLVDSPDVFKGFWENIRPLLHRYSALADFVTAEEVCSRYFAPGTAPVELLRR